MAKGRILFSWVAAIFGALYGAQLSYSGYMAEDPLLCAVVFAYVFWAFYWGVPIVWRWWWRVGLSRRHDTLLGWLLSAIFTLVVPLVGGYFYGVLGGGIYQFLKCRFRSKT